MIDCTKTTNYFNEKLKMTKRTKNGLCEIKCGNCPLCSNNNGEGECWNQPMPAEGGGE
jgi:hypothetical protein|nr:MAG TPA: hypothetical protein [Caudoviricetes sp.]